LTATIANGDMDAAGALRPYTKDFSITIFTIRKVTDIRNVPADAFTGELVDLSGAEVVPTDATNKAIVWSVKSAGTTGVVSISGSAFTPSAAGTLVLTATIANGDEDAAGTLRPYTKDFTIGVEAPVSTPGNIGMGDDTTIKLYANTGVTPLSDAVITTVAAGSSYFVRIDSSYTNAVWYLNGKKSTASGNRIYLETGKIGIVKVTVEATKNGVADTGTHTFKVE
jgi:hypothetical protein